MSAACTPIEKHLSEGHPLTDANLELLSTTATGDPGMEEKERHACRTVNLDRLLRRKVFGLSLGRQLMLEVQHLALDQDRYVNDMIEEAAKDLLKKYREKLNR